MSNTFDQQWQLMDSILDACNLQVERMRVKSFKLEIAADSFPLVTMVLSPNEIRPFTWAVTEGGKEDIMRKFRLQAVEIDGACPCDECVPKVVAMTTPTPIPRPAGFVAPSPIQLVEKAIK
jgi:hypothetical protein